MPMPPPKASTEGRRDRQVFHEMGQIVRALEHQGPQTPDELETLVGATVGARLLPRLSNRHVRLVFLPVLLVIGIQTLLRGLGIGA